MSKAFERLLLAKEILSQDELEGYKSMVIEDDPEKSLGKILLSEGVLSKDQWKTLEEDKKLYDIYRKVRRKKKKDDQVLQKIQQIGIVRKEEINLCLEEREKMRTEGKKIFLTDILLDKGYLTAYLVKKYSQKKKSSEEKKIGSHPEKWILNVASYLQDRFFVKIVIKNKLMTPEQLKQCRKSIKNHWPKKTLICAVKEMNLLSSKKIEKVKHVMESSIAEKYPYYNVQIRDLHLARLLARLQFISPWRLNKCLTKQLDMVKSKEYISLRQILMDDGYLSKYHFDLVLAKYTDLVNDNIPPEPLVPEEEIKLIRKQDIEKEIERAKSDVHIIIEEEDIDSFEFTEAEVEKIPDNKEILEEEDEEIEEIEPIEDLPDALENAHQKNLDLVFREDNEEVSWDEVEDDSDDEEDEFEELEAEIVDLESNEPFVQAQSVESSEIQFELVEQNATSEDSDDFVLEEDIVFDDWEDEVSETDVDLKAIGNKQKEQDPNISQECYSDDLADDDFHDLENS